jgi:adenylate kinase
VLYGNGEDTFHPHFREAWMCESAGVPLIGDGKNLIPTVHVRDLCSAVSAAVSAPPAERQYVVVVDKATSSQADIVGAIASGIGQGRTVVLDPSDERVLLSQLVDSEVLTTDMKFEADWLASVELEWAAGDGLPASIGVVRAEFVAARNLRPLRILMHGPPGSGKSHYAARLSRRYSLPVVSVGVLIQEAVEAKGAMAEAIAKSLEESAAALRAQGKGGAGDKKKDAGKAAAPPKKPPAKAKGKQPVNLAYDKPRISTEVLTELVRARLRSAVCANKGFILDSYPRSLEEAQALFGDNASAAAEEGGEAEAEAGGEDGEAKEAKAPRAPKYDPTTKVDFVVSLSVGEEEGALRFKALPEAEVVADHSDEKGFRRRYGRHAAINDPENEKNIAPTAFLVDVELLDMTPETLASDSAAMEQMALYIEKRGKPFNYHPTAEEVAAREAEQQQSRQAAEETARADAEAKLFIEEHQRTAREQQAQERVTQVLEDDRELVEVCSQPLRKYLMSNVIPALVEGLMEVSKVRPEDPIDHLAEFLFKKSVHDNASRAFF